jgi:hypothetical protein
VGSVNETQRGLTIRADADVTVVNDDVPTVLPLLNDGDILAAVVDAEPGDAVEIEPGLFVAHDRLREKSSS